MGTTTPRLSDELFGFKLMTSNFAVEPDGEEPKVVKRPWRERLTRRPWRPWVSTKVIMVTKYRPIIVRIGNVIIYHPSLDAQIRSLVEEKIVGTLIDR